MTTISFTTKRPIFGATWTSLAAAREGPSVMDTSTGSLRSKECARKGVVRAASHVEGQGLRPFRIPVDQRVVRFSARSPTPRPPHVLAVREAPQSCAWTADNPDAGSGSVACTGRLTSSRRGGTIDEQRLVVSWVPRADSHGMGAVSPALESR